MIPKPLAIACVLAAAAPAVATAPLAAADLACQPIRLTCAGFEPNWQFVLPGSGKIRFTDPENPDYQTKPIVIDACARFARGGIAVSAGAPLDLAATVTRKRCVEPNDKVRPYSVSISFKQGAATGNPRQVSGTGCCWR